MAHFSKLNSENTVVKVVVVSNDIATTEENGINFLNKLYNSTDVWKQTSYNTYGGVHRLGGTSFRKNYGCVNFKYDETKDAFIPPKPYNSWILNETTCLWESPIAYPTDNQDYIWNEINQTWDLKE